MGSVVVEDVDVVVELALGRVPEANADMGAMRARLATMANAATPRAANFFIWIPFRGYGF
jgi:hypothetical protein